ncbi:hypothetical protein HUT15_06315 [Streptomyces sp. NA03103]|nr:hypothetical protein HUT15_06315 [Streptomyces sp. NA03103]
MIGSGNIGTDLVIKVPVRGRDGTALAGLSVSMPSVRYDPKLLQSLVATLEAAVRALAEDLDEQF